MMLFKIKIAEEERVRGQEYINFRQGLRVITYLVQFFQEDPGGLSFSMNNVLGYQLMFFIGYIDCKARNRRNRMFGGPHELSHHQVVSILLGVTTAEPYLCTKISLIKLCAARKNFYYSPPLSRSTSSFELTASVNILRSDQNC